MSSKCVDCTHYVYGGDRTPCAECQEYWMRHGHPSAQCYESKEVSAFKKELKEKIKNMSTIEEVLSLL